MLMFFYYYFYFNLLNFDYLCQISINCFLLNFKWNNSYLNNSLISSKSGKNSKFGAEPDSNYSGFIS